MYDNLVGTSVYARLYDNQHPEWQLCRVISLCNAGIKVKSARTHSMHIIDKFDVAEDLRVDGAFVPWESDQKPYDGAFVVTLIDIILFLTLICFA